MNLLVTGATGFVGKRLVENLQQRFSLKIISRSKNKAFFAEAMGVNILYGDLLNRSFIDSACESIDCVIHLATTFDLKKAIEHNVVFIRNIISSCHYNGTKKIIFMSSINSKFKKQGPYSISKKLCEEEIIKSNLDYVILRPTLIYDDNGEVFIGRLAKFIKRFHIAPVIGTGEYQIQPIHLDDVISIIEKVLFANKERIYDLVGPDILTLNSLIDMIFDGLEIKKKRKIYLPIGLLRYLGQFIGIGRDKILEIDEDKTSNPDIIEEEFGISLISLKTRLDIIIQNIS